MDFITVGFCDDGWLKIKILAATEIYFEVCTQPRGLEDTLKTVCAIIPRMYRLDGDLMEAFDGGQAEISQIDINIIKRFAETYEFRQVDCALPGFEKLPLI